MLQSLIGDWLSESSLFVNIFIVLNSLANSYVLTIIFRLQLKSSVTVTNGAYVNTTENPIVVQIAATKTLPIVLTVPAFSSSRVSKYFMIWYFTNLSVKLCNAINYFGLFLL